MKILVIDMNLSPSWVDFLAENEIESIHWSSIGKSNALLTKKSWNMLEIMII